MKERNLLKIRYCADRLNWHLTLSTSFSWYHNIAVLTELQAEPLDETSVPLGALHRFHDSRPISIFDFETFWQDELYVARARGAVGKTHDVGEVKAVQLPANGLGPGPPPVATLM
jgi:hypothetical protein